MLSRLILSVTVLVPFAMAPIASAQGTSEVRGRIQDPQGRLSPASTSPSGTSTGMFRTTATGADGSYLILNVPPGRYDLTAELAGFSRFQRQGLVLEIGKTVVVDVQMQVGWPRRARHRHGRVSARRHHLQRGRWQYRRPRDAGPAGVQPQLDSVRVDVAGDRLRDRHRYVRRRHDPGERPGSRNNNFLLDGASNMDDLVGGRGGTRVRTPLLAIQEFQVITNQDHAEYGRTTGAVINAVSKSGTNELRWELFGLVQDAKLTAETFFVKRDDLEKPKTKQHQWGGTIGGPIVRSKAFYFGSLERVANDRANVIVIAQRPDLNWSPTVIERVWNTLGRSTIRSAATTPGRSVTCGNSRRASDRSQDVRRRPRPAPSTTSIRRTSGP